MHLSQSEDDALLGKSFDFLFEGRKALHRDQDRLYQWAKVSDMRFNKAKCWLWHLGHSEPRQLQRLREHFLESCPAEKEVGMLVDSQLNICQHMCPGGQKSQ